MTNPSPEVRIRFAIERFYEPPENRAKEGGPSAGLGAEFLELVDACKELFPVGFFSFEGNGGDAAAQLKFVIEITGINPIIQGRGDFDKKLTL